MCKAISEFARIGFANRQQILTALALARKISKDGRFRSHIRDTAYLGFGCFRFATIKERVNVQK